MPGGDRTGTEGYGEQTGRGLVYCSGYDSPGFTKGAPRGKGSGRGWSRGFGRGRGFWCREYYPYPYNRPSPYFREIYHEPSKEEEKSHLEDMVKGLESELNAIKERLQELSKEKKEES